MTAHYYLLSSSMRDEIKACNNSIVLLEAIPFGFWESPTFRTKN